VNPNVEHIVFIHVSCEYMQSMLLLFCVSNKGQGLAKTLTEGNEKALSISCVDMIAFVLDKLEHHIWYSDIVYYLKNLSCPFSLSDHKEEHLS
jgi:hypothetical protein